MTENEQDSHEEQEEEQFIRSLQKIYGDRRQNNRDLAEIRARLEQTIRDRSANRVAPTLREEVSLLDLEDMGKIESKPQVVEDSRHIQKLKSPRGRSSTFLHKRHTFIRSLESLAAILLILGLILGWVTLLPKIRAGKYTGKHTLSATQTVQVPQIIQVTPQSGPGTFMTQNLGSVYLPAWTSDSRFLSFVDGTGHAYVWNTATQVLTKTISLPGSVSPNPITTWNRAPGGRYLISMEHNTAIKVWDVITGQQLLSGASECFAWSVDGTRLAISNKHTVQLWELAPRKVLQRIPAGEGCPISWSPDGRKILLPSLDDQGFSVVDTATGSILWSQKLPSDAMGLLPAWSPDSQHLVTLVQEGATGDATYQQMWNAENGVPAGKLSVPGNMGELLWSQDGEHVLTATSLNITIWDAKTEETLLTLPNPAGDYTRYPDLPAVSPNGALFAVENGGPDVQVWSMTTGTKVSTYTHPSNLIRGGISWSPDSQSLVSAGEDGQVNVWNIANKQTIHSYPFPWHASTLAFFQETSLAWSPNGKWIAVISDRSIAAVVQAF